MEGAFGGGLLRPGRLPWPLTPVVLVAWAAQRVHGVAGARVLQLRKIAASKKWRRVDLVVNAAAMMTYKPITQVSVEE